MLRARDQRLDALIALFQWFIPLLNAHPLTGTLWIIDERRLRIRR